MEGYIDENRWIDLSGLPRFGGNCNLINWKKSIGCVLPFKYKSVCGNIKIVDVEVNKSSRVYITIDNYLPNPVKIYPTTLKNCELSHFVENRIADFRPDLIIFLSNKQDAFSYSICSEKTISVCCPICGYTRDVMVGNFTKYGFKCPVCGDGISYPEKFISSMLRQLDVKFIREVSSKDVGFEWCKKIRYDFYFQVNKNKYFVEADGGFHRSQEQKIIDYKKDCLADNHNIKMIRINCDYSSNNKFLYIKQQILNSDLNNIFNLNCVDWEMCNQDALSSMLVETCRLWEDGEKVHSEIAQIMNIDLTTVYKYLSEGFKMGLCPSYTKEESDLRYQKPVVCYKDNEFICAFRSTQIASEQLSNMYNRCFKKRVIQVVCQGHRGSYNGYNFKYITKEEYKQYKMIENNEVVKGGNIQ